MSNLSPEELKSLYSDGVDCFNEGNYIKAEGLLKEVIRNKPDLADIHNKLGVIANLGGNLEEAAERFRKAVDLNPGYTEASLNLAITLNELGRTGEATDLFDNLNKAMKGKPSGLDPFATGKIANEHYKLGLMYQEMGMYAEAVEEYRKALKLKPMADVQARLGIALRDHGDLEGAARELEQARKTNPEYTAAMVQLGLTYHLMGRAEEAFGLWEEALKKDPDLKEPRSFLKMFRKEG
jgi:tetratricopeptide (TPR) repeat protein